MICLSIEREFKIKSGHMFCLRIEMECFILFFLLLGAVSIRVWLQGQVDTRLGLGHMPRCTIACMLPDLRDPTLLGRALFADGQFCY